MDARQPPASPRLALGAWRLVRFHFMAQTHMRPTVLWGDQDSDQEPVGQGIGISPPYRLLM